MHGSAGGGGSRFVGDYRGSQITVSENNNVITLTFAEGSIILNPGQDGTENSRPEKNNPTGGAGGLVSLPNDMSSWQNVTSENGGDGAPGSAIFHVNGRTPTSDGIKRTASIIPTVGGSQNGGNGISLSENGNAGNGIAGGPGALKLEWFLKTSAPV